MIGDAIILTDERLQFGTQVADIVLTRVKDVRGKYAVAVAGESGSGKSTVALALAHALEQQGLRCVVLHQDDYYIYPAKTNDQKRRNDPDWNGIQEVNLDLLDRHIQKILDGVGELEKPLSIYEEDRFDLETIVTKDADVVIAEGSYVMLLKNVNTRIFIDRTYFDTRVYRQQRARYQAELDEFTEHILTIEHEIISQHRELADILITKTYEVQSIGGRDEVVSSDVCQ